MQRRLMAASAGTGGVFALVAWLAGVPGVAWGALGALGMGAVAAWLVGRRGTMVLASIYTRLGLLAEGRYTDLPLPSSPSRDLRELEERIASLAEALAEREGMYHASLLQARELETLKTDFVSTVSHELRTPLTSMRGALSLVLAGTVGELPLRARDLLRIAQQNTERLIRLINDILDIEKIEQGHVQLRREWCELGALVQATVRSVETLASDAGVALRAESSGDVFVTGDSDRLVQVFTNLVSNAIKHSPRGSTVRVRVDTDGHSARVHVADEGPGIPAEFQSKIFGRFQQAETHDAKKASGTGLGLAIARSLVELHDGSIGFECPGERGTVFTVSLPWTPPATATATRDGHRILLLDPDLGMLSVLATLCAPLGETFSVRAAREALEAARATRFDALLVDPAGAGDEVLAMVRALRRMPGYADVPVLLFSAAEYTSESLSGVVLQPQHAFVKSRDGEHEVVRRLRAVLAVRRPRLAA
jgi:signal transduction histidine kinase